MSKSLPIERVLKIRSELSLPRFFPCEDSMLDVINKLNIGFEQLAEFSGGRQGEKGEPGIEGCSVHDVVYNSNIDDVLEFVSGENIWTIDCENINDDKYLQIESIFNYFAHKNFVLSNLSNDEIETSQFLLNGEWSEIGFTTPFITQYGIDYKFNIINSDLEGNGKHILLTNSKFLQDNRQASCASGWIISGDYSENWIYADRDEIEAHQNIPTDLPTEILRIHGVKNPLIQQKQFVQIQSDFLELQRTSVGQSLRFFANDEENTWDSRYSGNFILQRQTETNEYRIPNRTGWVGIWQDTLNKREEYENLRPIYDFNIGRIFLRGSKVAITDDFPIEINRYESHLRFKRLNNWVLIDFHLRVQLIAGMTGEFAFKNVRFIQNIDTVGCKTDNWLPMTAYYQLNENDEFDDFEEWGRFQVYQNENRFEISVRKEFTLNQNRNYIYLDGQCWANVTDDPCPILELTDILDLCEPLDIG